MSTGGRRPLLREVTALARRSNPCGRSAIIIPYAPRAGVAPAPVQSTPSARPSIDPDRPWVGSMCMCAVGVGSNRVLSCLYACRSSATRTLSASVTTTIMHPHTHRGCGSNTSTLALALQGRGQKGIKMSDDVPAEVRGGSNRSECLLVNLMAGWHHPPPQCTVVSTSILPHDERHPPCPIAAEGEGGGGGGGATAPGRRDGARTRGHAPVGGGRQWRQWRQ